ncbi:MAG: hypothetical protein HY515_00015 [Candidatus Aenigmarchaeota archaeon]|nr:hypothetical protein [Candidatus Aenigmarchaeota archaeon]
MTVGYNSASRPEFFSAHYTINDPNDITGIGLPYQNGMSFQLHGKGPDRLPYNISLSGPMNPLGNFVFVGSSSREETPFFRELVGAMEKRYGGTASINSFPFNDRRKTASISTGSPASVADIIALQKLLKDTSRMSDFVFELFYDDLTEKPNPLVIHGKLDVRSYVTEEHPASYQQPPYRTRIYVDEPEL